MKPATESAGNKKPTFIAVAAARVGSSDSSIMTQHQKLGKLISRKAGATSMEIIASIGTVCPHRRLADLKALGWTILKYEVPGKNYHRYYGIGPKAD